MQAVVDALCSPGVEPLLQRELRAQGLRVLARERGRVAFVTDGEGLAFALLGLRTADRLLWRLWEGPCPDFNALYREARELPWERWLKGPPVVAKVRLGPGGFRSARGTQAVLERAIRDRWEHRRFRPSGKPVGLRLYSHEGRVEIGLDLTPVPLGRRGYRLEAGVAPLKSTLAAALVLWSGWGRRHPLWDPMCGSGSIVAEALLWACNRAPNLQREFHLPPALGVTQSDWARSRRRWQEAEVRPRDLKLWASDRDPQAVERSRSNLAALDLGEMSEAIRWEVADVFTSRPPVHRPWVITNPPWGLRLGREGNPAIRLVEWFRRGEVLGLTLITPYGERWPSLSRHRVRSGGQDLVVLVGKRSPQGS